MNQSPEARAQRSEVRTLNPQRSTLNLSRLSRRRLIQSLGGGFGAIGLAGMLANEASADVRPPHFAPSAKRVIQLFMNGGPFGGDLFDPKPLLEKHAGQRPAEVDLRTERKTAGLLPSPFRFSPCGESGTPVSELLPLVGSCIDDICVIRSVHTDNPNHGPALLLMNNGTIIPTRPSLGAWLSYGLGSDNDSLPGYVVLCPGRPVRFSILWTSAFLPGEHQGTYINHADLKPEKLIPWLDGGTGNPQAAERQRRQLELMRELNQKQLERSGPDQRLEARMRAMETAFRMQFAATDAFDLSRESKPVREAYGSGHFANACLMARRLAERGVRFTQIYYGDGQPWDTHNDHNQKVQQLCRDIDRPIAALLGDLKQRGLLHDTLVIWGGEFGRTPTSENGNGRDHNHYGFTMWLAGGGVKGGMTYGETDDFGFAAVHDRVHIHDLHATILHLLGLDHERLTYRYAGRDFRLTDVEGRVVREVLA
ncbi:MAG: DUF1501 domain-containing protein [Planctomycetes bacterium]|nr:DUF1501 domain-containing protein [Planctomycetota bacterium]